MVVARDSCKNEWSCEKVDGFNYSNYSPLNWLDTLVFPNIWCWFLRTFILHANTSLKNIHPLMYFLSREYMNWNVIVTFISGYFCKSKKNIFFPFYFPYFNRKYANLLTWKKWIHISPLPVGIFCAHKTDKASRFKRRAHIIPHLQVTPNKIRHIFQFPWLLSHALSFRKCQ